MSFLQRKRTEGPSGLSHLQSEMNRLFENFFDRWELPSVFGSSGFAPVVDVAETAEEVMVKAEIPGVDPKDLDISVTGDMLTIKGEKKSEREEKEKNFHLVERSYGSFSRSVSLPAYAETERVNADYKDGVLSIHFPKKEEAREKSIKIDVE